MLFQQSWRSSHICWALVGCFSFTLQSNSFQTISIGLRLADCGGQVIWFSTPSLSFLVWQCQQQSTPTPSHLLLHASRWESHMRRSSVHLLCVSQRLSSVNQKSQIRTHQTKGQISTGLMSIACISWPKQVSSSYLSFSSDFFATIRPWMPDSHRFLWTFDVEMCLLYELGEAFIGLQFLRLVTQMNLSSAAEVTLGLPFLWQSSWEPVSS